MLFFLPQDNLDKFGLRFQQFNGAKSWGSIGLMQTMICILSLLFGDLAEIILQE